MLPILQFTKKTFQKPGKSVLKNRVKNLVRTWPRILPKIWLMTDPRFGDRLLRSVQKLPAQSGVILRHYGDMQRQEIHKNIAKICRRRGHKLVIACDSALLSALPGALQCDGHYYGRPIKVAVLRRTSLLLIGVHNIYEMNRAQLSQPDLLLLSPIFATNSHKSAATLGPLRFRQLASRTNIPTLALGGMDRKRAAMIGHGYAAIDGLID